MKIHGHLFFKLKRLLYILLFIKIKFKANKCILHSQILSTKVSRIKGVIDLLPSVLITTCIIVFPFQS